MSEFINTLELRFKDNMHRHNNVKWEDVVTVLNSNSELLDVVTKMELTGGNPDVVVFNDELYYVDFSKDSPHNRRSLCYDKVALDNRKNNKPLSDAISEANKIGITILNEEEYYYLQSLEDLDLKTSSWILSNDDIRVLGGAKFCEKRYKQTFTFHNGADSYYSSRGFRGKIKLVK